MKALVYTGPKSMDFIDFEAPTPEKGVAIVRNAAIGICGSDMHGYLGHDERRVPPLILGHEAAGVVSAGALAGKRVAVNPLVACGVCDDCKAGAHHICQHRQLLSIPPRQGAFAEFVAVPEDNLVEVPDGFSLTKAALTEPLAVCWHAVKIGERLVGGDLSKTRTLIIGGGAIGLGCALSLRVFGASDITISEPNELRRNGLKTTGDWTLIEPSDTGSGYDLVIDAVGYGPTRAVASAAVRQGGAIVHLGLGDSEPGLDTRRLTLQEIAFSGSYCYTPQEFRDTAAAIFDGRYGDLDWPETRNLSDGAGAFADILAGKVAAAKIILEI